jgi:predicted nucleic acid-binding protein
LSVVVDASVLVAALVDSGPHGAWAENALARGSPYAPELAPVEATNIFRRLERAKIITTPEANAAQDDLMQLDMELFSFEPFADRVWELRHNRLRSMSRDAALHHKKRSRQMCRRCQWRARNFAPTQFTRPR